MSLDGFQARDALEPVAQLGRFIDGKPRPTDDLTRLQTGGSVVDGELIATMYRGRTSFGPILLLILAALVAVVVALLVSGAGDSVLAWVAQTYQQVADLVRGWTQ